MEAARGGFGHQSIRMGMRRMTRLTNGFSKKWENLEAAYSLWFAFYNFCRVHTRLFALRLRCKRTYPTTCGSCLSFWPRNLNRGLLPARYVYLSARRIRLLNAFKIGSGFLFGIFHIHSNFTQEFGRRY